MSKGLELLLAANETKNKLTIYRSTLDGIVDVWLMLMKRYLEKAHAENNPLDRAWNIVEFLENEGRDYITNQSEAERDTDEKILRFGTGSNKIQLQQQFRTRKQSNDEDYMRNLDVLEGLRSQGFPNEEVTVRRYEIMQRFIEGIRSFEFTVQQYLSMRGPTRVENYPAPQQQQQPVLACQQNQIPAAAPLAPNVQQPPQQPRAYRQQPQRACFHCGDSLHFVTDCPLKDRAGKPVQQAVNSCRTKIAGEWVCPSNPQGMNNDVVPAALPEQGKTTFCVNCVRTGTRHQNAWCLRMQQQKNK